MTDAQELTKALGGRWRGSYGSACCPAHRDHSPSLTIREGATGVTLVWCQTGCSPGAIIETLKRKGLWEGRGSNYTPPDSVELRRKAAEDEAKQQRRIQHARDLWRQSVPIEGTTAERYLREARAISGPLPPSLRYLAGTPHCATGLILPALVAAVAHWPDRLLRGIHRTFLRADGMGKANITQPKLMLGPCNGGAVRLAPTAGHMAVTEGIETGLSVQLETGLPTWAALSTSGLAALTLPDDTQEVSIYADHDANCAGEKAARKAAAKWRAEGRKVKVLMPRECGQDFNDLAREVAP